ncbi:hypothetical protein SGPA1_21994 [Streptomyces misionensis JCM 4497]
MGPDRHPSARLDGRAAGARLRLRRRGPGRRDAGRRPDQGGPDPARPRRIRRDRPQSAAEGPRRAQPPRPDAAAAHQPHRGIHQCRGADRRAHRRRRRRTGAAHPERPRRLSARHQPAGPGRPFRLGPRAGRAAPTAPRPGRGEPRASAPHPPDGHHGTHRLRSLGRAPPTGTAGHREFPRARGHPEASAGRVPSRRLPPPCPHHGRTAPRPAVEPRPGPRRALAPLPRRTPDRTPNPQPRMVATRHHHEPFRARMRDRFPGRAGLRSDDRGRKHPRGPGGDRQRARVRRRTRARRRGAARSRGRAGVRGRLRVRVPGGRDAVPRADTDLRPERGGTQQAPAQVHGRTGARGPGGGHAGPGGPRHRHPARALGRARRRLWPGHVPVRARVRPRDRAGPGADGVAGSRRRHRLRRQPGRPARQQPQERARPSPDVGDRLRDGRDGRQRVHHGAPARSGGRPRLRARGGLRGRARVRAQPDGLGAVGGPGTDMAAAHRAATLAADRVPGRRLRAGRAAAGRRGVPVPARPAPRALGHQAHAPHDPRLLTTCTPDPGPRRTPVDTRNGVVTRP